MRRLAWHLLSPSKRPRPSLQPQGLVLTQGQTALACGSHLRSAPGWRPHRALLIPGPLHVGPSAHTGAPEPPQGQVGPSARGFWSWACGGQGAAALPLRSDAGKDGEPASAPSPDVTKGPAVPSRAQVLWALLLLKSELGVLGGRRQTERQTNRGRERKE